jgi:hypothetical protein
MHIYITYLCIYLFILFFYVELFQKSDIFSISIKIIQQTPPRRLVFMREVVETRLGEKYFLCNSPSVDVIILKGCYND